MDNQTIKNRQLRIELYNDLVSEADTIDKINSIAKYLTKYDDIPDNIITDISSVINDEMNEEVIAIFDGIISDVVSLSSQGDIVENEHYKNVLKAALRNNTDLISKYIK